MCYNIKSRKKQDNTPKVLKGAQYAFKWGGIIESNDNLGGYNTTFTLPQGALAYYHVHFKLGTTQVKCIRYCTSGGYKENVVLNDGKCKCLSVVKLLKYTRNKFEYDCPNLIQLLTNLANALDNVPVGKNNQYKNEN